MHRSSGGLLRPFRSAAGRRKRALPHSVCMPWSSNAERAMMIRVEASGTNIPARGSAGGTYDPGTARGGGLMASKKVRIGIVGVGNCASSLVQGITYYRDASGNEPIPGLMNADLGGYHVGDLEIACAFDVAAGKVGHDVAEAIYAAPNNTHRFADV